MVCYRKLDAKFILFCKHRLSVIFPGWLYQLKTLTSKETRCFRELNRIRTGPKRFHYFLNSKTRSYFYGTRTILQIHQDYMILIGQVKERDRPRQGNSESITKIQR